MRSVFPALAKTSRWNLVEPRHQSFFVISVTRTIFKPLQSVVATACLPTVPGLIFAGLVKKSLTEVDW